MTVCKWAETAGLTSKDVPSQQVALQTEINEFNDATTPVDRLDGVCDAMFVRDVIECISPTAKDALDAQNKTALVINEALKEFTQDQITTGFIEVVSSNFSKFCRTVSEAYQSCEWYANNGLQVYSSKVGDLYVIRAMGEQHWNNEIVPNGKIMKGVNYFPPKLEGIV